LIASESLDGRDHLTQGDGMAGLLVSVRSVAEARAAVGAGADVIDVKEPRLGPLGPAHPDVWRAVRLAVPCEIPVSAALGELADWSAATFRFCLLASGLSYVKLGLAGCGSRPPAEWKRGWRSARESLAAPGGPEWVVVVYVDWSAARAPHPDDVLGFTLETDCSGVLFDTWDKRGTSPVDDSWAGWIRRIQDSGRFVALAGGLDEAAIARQRALQPDLFAVRGSACVGGDRLAAIDPERIARLARAVRCEAASFARCGRAKPIPATPSDSPFEQGERRRSPSGSCVEQGEGSRTPSSSAL